MKVMCSGGCAVAGAAHAVLMVLCCAVLRSVHGNALRWLLWVEDSDNEHIYHSGKRLVKFAPLR